MNTLSLKLCYLDDNFKSYDDDLVSARHCDVAGHVGHVGCLPGQAAAGRGARVVGKVMIRSL